MRPARLEVPKKEIEREESVIGNQKSLFFPLTDKTNYQIANKFCSLVEDGIYSVNRNFKVINI